MTIQLSVDARDDMLLAFEAELGATPGLLIRSGAPPATCATADSGTVGATMALPADPFAAPSAGAMAKTGTWEDATADASITAGHFRLYKNGNTVCVLQGTITVTSGGGDLELDSVSITAGQTITITTFTLTMAGA